VLALAKARTKLSICWGLDWVSRSRRNSGGREAGFIRNFFGCGINVAAVAAIPGGVRRKHAAVVAFT